MVWTLLDSVPFLCAPFSHLQRPSPVGERGVCDTNQLQTNAAAYLHGEVYVQNLFVEIRKVRPVITSGNGCDETS